MLSEYEKSQLIDVDVDFFLVLCNKKQGATKCVNNGKSCYLIKHATYVRLKQGIQRNQLHSETH